MNESLDNLNIDAGQLETLARGALDESVYHLDAQTLSRLNQARQSAVAANVTRVNWQKWMPAGALAAVLALAVVLPMGNGSDTTGVTPFPVASFESGLGENTAVVVEDPELLEDLDMMLWLLDEDIHAS